MSLCRQCRCGYLSLSLSLSVPVCRFVRKAPERLFRGATPAQCSAVGPIVHTGAWKTCQRQANMIESPTTIAAGHRHSPLNPLSPNPSLQPGLGACPSMRICRTCACALIFLLFVGLPLFNSVDSVPCLQLAHRSFLMLSKRLHAGPCERGLAVLKPKGPTTEAEDPQPHQGYL